jgi:hypothetical protein
MPTPGQGALGSLVSLPVYELCVVHGADDGGSGGVPGLLCEGATAGAFDV